MLQILTFGIVLLSLVFPAAEAGAANIIPPSCSTDFYNVLEARAWTQGKRESETAEKLILRPDSVMEYTCFVPRISNYGAAMSNTYLGSNFSFTSGGGVGPDASTCLDMSTVWEFLKCRNFDIADFRTFTELQANDFRTLPQACNETNRANKWSTNIAAAAPAAGGLGGLDAFSVFTAQFWNQGGGGNCADPLPTGVMADNDGVGPLVAYPDKVCPTPGCYFDPVNLSTLGDDVCSQ